jgi:glutamate synthase (NADPH/NADH) small chain
VTVFERADAIGGLLRYGIPDFKLEKWVVDRRIRVMQEEGIDFRPSTNVGVDVKASRLMDEYDALLLCGGSTVPRDLPIPGRHLKGVHFAMEFLPQQNARLGGRPVPGKAEIWATGKNVMVIGGGDTGSDCVGTSKRHSANSVTQIELLPMPPQDRHDSTPWPHWPMMLRTSTSHEEGCDRHWAIMTKEFVGDENGNLKAVKLVNLEWAKAESGKPPRFEEVPGSEREVPCELALLAMGFLHPQKEGMIEQLGVDLDERGNVKANHYQTSVSKVFSAGDMRRGQSLVVWAISEGREAARQVDLFLMGESKLESKEIGALNVAQAVAL